MGLPAWQGGRSRVGEVARGVQQRPVDPPSFSTQACELLKGAKLVGWGERLTRPIPLLLLGRARPCNRRASVGSPPIAETSFPISR